MTRGRRRGVILASGKRLAGSSNVSIDVPSGASVSVIGRTASVTTTSGSGTTHYVSPTGSGTALTLAAPSALSYGLSGGGGTIQSGDTLRLLDGLYSTSSTLTSTLVNVRVEAAPGTHPRIVSSDPLVLQIDGSDSTYVGLDVSFTYPDRTFEYGGAGINIHGPRTKVINCFVHDAENTIGLWSPADDSIIYGCVTMHAGYSSPASQVGEGRGYSIYMQSDSSPTIKANHFLMGFSFGMHAYTEAGTINGFNILDNTLAQAGITNYVSNNFHPNVVIGGPGVNHAEDNTITGNTMFHGPHIAPVTAGGGNNLAYGSGMINSTVTNNVFVGTPELAVSLGGPISEQSVTRNNTVTGNTFVGAMTQADIDTYPSNSFVEYKPTTGTIIKTIANEYQSNRTELSIINWAETSTVSVSIASGLYEIHNAFDYWGGRRTVLSNGTLVVPMTGWTVQAPNNAPTPAHPGAIFGDFILLKQDVAYQYDWTGSNGAAWHANWTTSGSSAGGTIDIQSNQGRMLTTSTNFMVCRAILATSAFNAANGDILVDTATTASVGQAQIIFRGSGTWDGSEPDSPTTGYKVFLNHAGNYFEIYKRTGGVTTQVGTQQAFTFAINTTYRNRVRFEGSSIKVKIWDATALEPGTWTYETTDSTITAAGQVHLSFRTVSSAVRDLRWDNLFITNI